MSNYLTAREVAIILKISKALAYQWIARGIIPSFRVDKTVRVRQEDLEEFIKQNSTDHSKENTYNKIKVGEQL